MQIEKESSPVFYTLLWILLAISSIVSLEPAPYDILALAILVGLFVFGLRIPPGLGLPLLLLFFYVIANILSTVVSPEPIKASIYMAITMFLLVTWLLFTCLVYYNPQNIVKIIWSGYTVATIIAVILGALAYFQIIPNYQQFLYEGRASGPFKDANVYGPFLIPVALYLLLMLEQTIGYRRWLYLALLLFIIFGILISFSRGAWGNLALSFLIYFVLRFLTASSTAEIRSILTISAGIFLFAVTLIVVAISTNRIGAIFYERALLYQDYDSGRFDSLWQALLYSFENPLGIGPGQSGLIFNPEPHNLFIHNLVETGWLGGVSLTIFLLLTLWRSFPACLVSSPMQKFCIIAYASTAGLLVESMIIHSTHWRHLYLLLALLWGSSLSIKQHQAA